ncbi:MAG: helix-turn-helix domain-containing protein [Candidatus Limnocylindrales bacterium]
MTSTNPTRRSTRRLIGQRASHAGAGLDGRSVVGERLRDARELRGVDLYRVERDTKIRAKYLADLEQGDFSDLPGDVYTRGFLRNYATYLGLDADEIEEEWRREAGGRAPISQLIVGPQPLTIRRGVAFQRSHVIIAVVAVIVLAVAGYFGYQLTRYLSYPTLAVSSGGSAPITVPIGTTSYVLKGTATPGTTVLIVWNGQDPQVVLADDAGQWSYKAVLQNGPNQFDIHAENLDTSHASNTVRLIVIVPIPTPTPMTPVVVVTAPADGAALTNGSVAVTGTTTDVATIMVNPTYLGPPLAPGSTLPPPTPSAPAAASGSATPATIASAGPSGTPGPQPVTTKTGADGTFAVNLTLTPGRWQLTLVGTSASGASTAPLTRTVTVPFKGINVLIQIKGGSASVSVYHDGITDTPPYTQADGWTMTVVANKYVCVRSTRPTLVFITVNGTPYGPISGFGGQRAYIDVNGPRNAASC